MCAKESKVPQKLKLWYFVIMGGSIQFPKTLAGSIFSFRKLVEAGFSQRQIDHWLREELIERLARGIYRLTAADISEEEQFAIASIWAGKPSAICLLSALSYYGLTDEIPKKTWIMVPHSKISRQKNLQLLRVRTPRWEIGITKQKEFWITDVTRTIVDAFAHSRLISNQVAVESLRRAIEQGSTTMKAVYEMAIQFEIGHRVLPYVGVWA